jgi:hypothetical protein
MANYMKLMNLRYRWMLFITLLQSAGSCVEKDDCFLLPVHRFDNELAVLEYEIFRLCATAGSFAKRKRRERAGGEDRSGRGRRPAGIEGSSGIGAATTSGRARMIEMHKLTHRQR